MPRHMKIKQWRKKESYYWSLKGTIYITFAVTCYWQVIPLNYISNINRCGLFGGGWSLAFQSLCVYGSLVFPETLCLWDFALHHGGFRSEALNCQGLMWWRSHNIAFPFLYPEHTLLFLSFIVSGSASSTPKFSGS